ncbi:hypothetical protein L1987_57734 [Smallanthus sonchifolius]|uniref:Uncharacterized protein n=1 Tax=Smallanthus sonchifolius TaxID=185202 RepID=A0ACB9DDU3_9ASTR|nr:hypothetical protein L1987_57734 [Smallanthus sonchifolius]
MFAGGSELADGVYIQQLCELDVSYPIHSELIIGELAELFSELTTISDFDLNLRGEVQNEEEEIEEPVNGNVPSPQQQRQDNSSESTESDNHDDVNVHSREASTDSSSEGVTDAQHKAVLEALDKGSSGGSDSAQQDVHVIDKCDKRKTTESTEALDDSDSDQGDKIGALFDHDNVDMIDDDEDD